MDVKLLVDGGAMKPGPAVSQKLGPIGININEVISKVNEATMGFKGMQVPVTIIVNSKTKTFEVEVSSPPISGMIKKEAGIQKGSGLQKKLNSANISIEQVIKVANAKLPNLLCKDLKSAVKTTVGSCVSLGILIENKPAVEIEEEIDAGVYDKQIKGCIIETPEEKKQQLDDYFKPLKADQEKKNKPADEGTTKKKK
jgi:large subunit ribosomal protein L11